MQMDDLINNIIQGDCLEVMKSIPDNSIDCIITDPPYSSGGLHKGSRSNNPVDKYTNGNFTNYITFSGDNRDQLSWMTWISIVFNQCFGVLKPSGYFLTFCDWRQITACSLMIQWGNIIYRGIIVWNKTRSSRLVSRQYFRHQSEFILWGTKGDCIDLNPDRKDWDGVLEYPISLNKLHPTEKPIPMVSRLFECVPKGAIVLDPFLGSGTTAVAALRTGRRFIGIELSEEYCNIARKRVNEELAQPILFELNTTQNNSNNYEEQILINE